MDLLAAQIIRAADAIRDAAPRSEVMGLSRLIARHYKGAAHGSDTEGDLLSARYDWRAIRGELNQVYPELVLGSRNIASTPVPSTEVAFLDALIEVALVENKAVGQELRCYRAGLDVCEP